MNKEKIDNYLKNVVPLSPVAQLSPAALILIFLGALLGSMIGAYIANP